MEPVGAACAVAQFLGLAGQAIQAIGWLRQEFKDIKSAPKLIKKIHHELKVFENTLVQLSSIEQSRFSDDAARSFEATLTDCAEIVDNLWNELSKHDFDKHVAGAKKLWKQIVANEKRSEFENYLKRLENAKTSLQLTMSGMQLEMTNDFQALYTTHARRVEGSLNRVEVGISSVQTVSNKIHDNTTDIVTKVETVTNMVTGIAQSVQDLRKDMPALVEQGIARCLDKTLEESLKKTILYQSANMVDNNRMLESSPHSKSYNKSTFDAFDHVRLELPTTTASQPHSIDVNKTTVEASHSKPLPGELTSRRKIGKAAIHTKTYIRNIPLPMGFIQMKTVQRVYREVTDNGTVIERETTHMDISFIPFRWLSSRGQVTFIDKHYDAHNRSFWTYNPRIYNRVSNDSMIIQACEKKDIGAIRTLFQYRQASPFDTCSNGSSLMKQAIGAVGLEHDDHYWGQALEVIRFLISQGADPATFMAECLEKYHECSISCWAFFGDHEHQDISTKGIDEIWGFCLSSCQRDPFTDTRVLEMLWDHSLGGQCLPRVDPASLFHDTFTGFENLVFENPDKIFSDLMEDATSLGGGPLSTWRTLIDQKYQTMAYLCSGGSESIKERTFSGLRQDSASTTWQEDSCFCPETSSHLLFKLLYRTRLWKRTKNRQDVLQNHVYRMLILLFQSGEDPQATCACTTRWQRKGEFRTATDVAASEGILGVWRDALEASGFDATAIIDEWQFDGIPLLYEMPSLEPRPLMAPLRLVGNAVHLALSSFV